MLEARAGHAEVVKPTGQHHAGDRDAELAEVGEVRQAEPSRRVLLAEHDLLLRPVQRPPAADAPLQRAADAGAHVRMAAQHLLEDRHRAQSRRRGQHRQDLVLPDPGKGVGSPPLTGFARLGRRSWIGLDPIGGRGAEAGLRRGDSGTVGGTERHVEPHLAVGDVSARHATRPLFRGSSEPNHLHRRSQPPREAAARVAAPPGDLRPPYVTATRSILILIVALFSS